MVRRRLYTLGLAILVVLAVVTGVVAGARPAEELKTARAEVEGLPPASVRGENTAVERVVDLRDPAALVLVGGMLLGLAAAVRRTV